MAEKNVNITVNLTELNKNKFSPQELSIPEDTTSSATTIGEEFARVVDKLIDIDTEEFVKVIMWAKVHNNKLPRYFATNENADDYYATALSIICNNAESLAIALSLIEQKKYKTLLTLLETIKLIRA